MFPTVNLLYVVFWSPSSSDIAYRIFAGLGWLGQLLMFFGVVINGLSRLPGPSPGSPSLIPSPNGRSTHLWRAHLIAFPLAHMLGGVLLTASLATFVDIDQLAVFFMIVFAWFTTTLILLLAIAESKKIDPRATTTPR